MSGALSVPFGDGGYGLTETYGPFTICEWHPEWDALPNEQRLALKMRQGVPDITAGYIRIVDSDGNDVPWDGKTIGEIIMRGNDVVQGYHKAPADNAKAFKGGWFYSGDGGVFHPDGYVEVKDRFKDVIISGGENIIGVEVETLPYTDRIYDAVVMNFGLLHSLRPEQVAAEAFRVLKPGGRFACTVWASPQVSAGFRIVLGAIEKYGTMNVPLPPAQPYFRFSDKRESYALLARAGFEHLRFEIVPLVWQLTSAEEMFQAFYQGAVRATVILRSQSKEARDAIHPHVIREAEAFKAIGGLEVPMGAALTVGTRPMMP